MTPYSEMFDKAKMDRKRMKQIENIECERKEHIFYNIDASENKYQNLYKNTDRPQNSPFSAGLIAVMMLIAVGLLAVQSGILDQNEAYQTVVSVVTEEIPSIVSKEIDKTKKVESYIETDIETVE